MYDGLYVSVMIATTVGFGDIVPTSQGARAYAIFHMVSSVALFGAVVGNLVAMLEKRAANMRKEEALAKQLDAALIDELDPLGKGLDKAEYVLGMLSALDLVSPCDFAPFIEQFEQFDRNGDGRLTRDDLSVLLDQRRVVLEDNQAAEDKLAAARLKRAALRLLPFVFVMLFSFMWWSMFGCGHGGV